MTQLRAILLECKTVGRLIFKHGRPSLMARLYDANTKAAKDWYRALPAGQRWFVRTSLHTIAATFMAVLVYICAVLCLTSGPP